MLEKVVVTIAHSFECVGIYFGTYENDTRSATIFFYFETLNKYCIHGYLE